MSSSGQCKECGTPLPPESPAGLCAQCLFALGLAAQEHPEVMDDSLAPWPANPRDAAASASGVAPEGAVPSAGPRAPPDSRPKPGHVKPGTTVIVPVTEKPGDIIGHYKLLQQIGQGGFGVVYMAQQQEPVKRRVALKIVKLGMDTKQVVARFEAERQALALMDHPNIAKILDAGATDTGRPYFVMELVKGIRITDYCDQNHLSPRERLNLFVQICRAVQHAHQKGIIHRDLKPSNILVTLHDGVPVPKIIDFGIAKATQQELTEQTVFTQFGQFIGTPAYMSPEQAEMSGLDVDTRSDIYSLGVLLYELLTGKTPFDPQELMSAGLEEMRRTLREKEPARPSTRLSTLIGEELTLTARLRRVEGPKLVRLIRGDLDWIVMKCLEKDRTRRYETASGFADDIENFLKNEPVSARPPSQLYRFQRLVRRNKAAFAASAAVALSIIVALVVSIWMYMREREGRLRSDEVTRFLEAMLQGVGPSVAQGRDTAVLEEILDDTANRVTLELKDQPAVAAQICTIIGEVYRAIGQDKQAEQMHRLALNLHGRSSDRNRAELATTLDDLGGVFWEQSKLAEAEGLRRRALELRRQVYGAKSTEVAKAMNNLAVVLRDRGKWSEAEDLHHQALAIQLGDGPQSTAVATTLNNLGHLLRDQGRFAEAQTNFERTLTIYRKIGEDRPEVALALGNLAFVQLDRGNDTQAEALAQQSLELLHKLYRGREHRDVAIALHNLGLIYSAQGKLAEAQTNFEQALAMRRNTLGKDNLQVAISLDNLALVLRKRKLLDEAKDRENEALATCRKVVGNEHLAVAVSLNSLGLILQDQKRLDEADRAFRDALAMQKRCLGTDEHPLFIATTLHNLGLLRRDQGRLPEAETDLATALAMREKGLGLQHPSTLAVRKELSELQALERAGTGPAQAADARSK